MHSIEQSTVIRESLATHLFWFVMTDSGKRPTAHTMQYSPIAWSYKIILGFSCQLSVGLLEPQCIYLGLIDMITCQSTHDGSAITITLIHKTCLNAGFNVFFPQKSIFSHFLVKHFKWNSFLLFIGVIYRNCVIS